MNCKKILAIFLLTAFLIPSLTIAKSEDAGKKGGDGDMDSGYCKGLGNMLSKIDQRMNNGNNGIEKKREEVNNRIREQREEREQKREEKREKWDLNREEHFNLILERAITEEQKEAVSEIIERIREAIQNKRIALDNVMSDFHGAMDELKNNRNQNANRVMNNYRNEIKLVFELSENECNNGVDPKTVRENLRNRLRDAKNNFNNSKPVVEDAKEKLNEIINIKQEAIKNVLDIFKAEIGEILSGLKTVIEK